MRPDSITKRAAGPILGFFLHSTFIIMHESKTIFSLFFLTDGEKIPIHDVIPTLAVIRTLVFSYGFLLLNPTKERERPLETKRSGCTRNVVDHALDRRRGS